jgi:hypothetical protein
LRLLSIAFFPGIITVKVTYLKELPLRYDFISYEELLRETVDGVFTAYYDSMEEDTSWVAILHRGQLYYAGIYSSGLEDVSQTLNTSGWRNHFFIRMENPLEYSFSHDVRNVNTQERVRP